MGTFVQTRNAPVSEAAREPDESVFQPKAVKTQTEKVLLCGFLPEVSGGFS